MTPDEFEPRLIELEIKASFAEDLVDHLNRAVARQQDQIDRLLREVAELRQQQGPIDSPGAARNLRDELPPHYCRAVGAFGRTGSGVEAQRASTLPRPRLRRAHPLSCGVAFQTP